MRILRGGSAEIRSNQWHKFDIELDESDLQAIVVKYNLAYAQLSVVQKYKILVKQAELLVTAEMQAHGAEGEYSLASLNEDLLGYLETLPKAA